MPNTPARGARRDWPAPRRSAEAAPARQRPSAPVSADGLQASDGQRTLRASQTQGLSPAGQQVGVAGSGYDESKGIYVAFCVVTPPTTAPSPCGGGIDQTGATGASAWVSSNPPDYGVGLATPYGPGGSFSVNITVRPGDRRRLRLPPDPVRHRQPQRPPAHRRPHPGHLRAGHLRGRRRPAPRDGPAGHHPAEHGAAHHHRPAAPAHHHGAGPAPRPPRSAPTASPAPPAIAP